MRQLVQHLRDDSIFMCSYAAVGTESTRELYMYVFLCVSWYSIYERTLYLCVPMRQLVPLVHQLRFISHLKRHISRINYFTSLATKIYI